MLICGRLRVPRELVGIPRYPASPVPALATLAVAAIGITVAGLLLDVLQGPDPDPNNAAGGVVDNPWAWLSLVPDLSAGVVEEIVIVAVPVLVGRRAGWHPAVIIGVSMVLRWPFHIHHGAWSSLPWAMLWGGCYAAAFLYLRRLAPLIVFHAGYDAVIDLQSAYGDTGGTIAIIVGAVLLAGLALRIVPDRRRRFNPAAPTGDPEVARYLLARGGPRSIAILTGGAVVVAGIIAVGIGLAPDPTSRLVLGVLIAVTLLVGGRVLWAGWVASNVIVRRDPTGGITGVIRWHTTYTGDTSIDTITGSIDEVDAIATVARLDGNTVVLAPTRGRRARLAAAGWATPHRRNPLRRIRIPADQANGLAQPPDTGDRHLTWRRPGGRPDRRAAPRMADPTRGPTFLRRPHGGRDASVRAPGPVDHRAMDDPPTTRPAPRLP